MNSPSRLLQLGSLPVVPQPSRLPEPRRFDSYDIPRTDEFCDLEIQCGNRSFKVHKAVVCDRSSVLHAAMTDERKESSTDTFSIREFTPDVVDRMLDFMYKGSYNPHKTEAKAPRTRDNEPQPNATGDALYVHLDMNAIAVSYGVDELREESISQIRRLLVDPWQVMCPWYSTFLKEAFERTKDVMLQSWLVALTSELVDALYEVMFSCGLREEAREKAPEWFYSSVLGGVF